MQDCSNSSVLAMEILQSCTKPSISCCIDLILIMIIWFSTTCKNVNEWSISESHRKVQVVMMSTLVAMEVEYHITDPLCGESSSPVTSSQKNQLCGKFSHVTFSTCTVLSYICSQPWVIERWHTWMKLSLCDNRPNYIWPYCYEGILIKRNFVWGSEIAFT